MDATDLGGALLGKAEDCGSCESIAIELASHLARLDAVNSTRAAAIPKR
jgi:hypothetical protein